MPGLDAWRATWTRLGVAAPDEAVYRDLIARYSESHRKYHTLQHLDECFDKLRELRADAVHPEEIELALWYHDAIYDVRRQDNEARSAELARSKILAAGLPTAVADRVHAMVMSTRHDAAPSGTDEKILVDVDLSILGAAPERFDEYERQVREEYRWVPEPVFRVRRRSILKEFLERPTIFNTRTFIDAYEAQARANIERSQRQ
jgi:predicted metal-dependent HD superfamily phosphohydrolase